MAASATFNPGRALGPYTILAPTGRDSRNQLFHAHDTRVDRPVLVKVIAAHPGRRKLLLRNAAATGSFSHPHVLCLLEIGEDYAQDCLYLVSEHVSGNTLRSVMAGRLYSPRRSIGLAVQLAETVADAHGVDLVHGDLTPEDIIITPKGDGKILHMGLATEKAGNRVRPADGYMSPERILGASIDYGTDVFSLGAILFELLTGSPPPVGGTADVAQQMEAAFQLPSGFTPRWSTDLRTTVANALAMSLNARCGSAAAFAAELRAVAAILDLGRVSRAD